MTKSSHKHYEYWVFAIVRRLYLKKKNIRVSYHSHIAINYTVRLIVHNTPVCVFSSFHFLRSGTLFLSHRK
jgi:hypothetical protein